MHRERGSPIKAILLAALTLFASLEAAAQERRTIPALDFARIAMEAGDFDTARDVLTSLLAHDPGAVEPNLLMAQLEARQGHLKAAVERYQSVLAGRPDLATARLELAAVLFALRDDERALFHLYHAMAGDLTDADRELALRFVATIRARKRYDLTVSVAASPDTNINAASGAREVTLFGLPFRTEDTEEESGVGLIFAAAGEVRAPVTPAIRLRGTAATRRNEYSGSRFDDQLLSVGMGPQLLSGDWDLRMHGVVAKRWYGHDAYNIGFGPRVEARYFGYQSIILESAAEFLDVDYDEFDERDGQYYAVNAGVTYLPDPTSSIQLYLGLSRELAEEDALSNRGYRVALGFAKQLRYGISVYAQPELFLFRYDGRDEALGSTRRDWVSRAQLGAYNRTWSVLGFSPVLIYTYTRDWSNQEIYSYSRHQVQLGVTQNF